MKKIYWIIPALVVGWCATGFADVAQIKIYKEAFPDAKPKCIMCHTDALPKKDKGKHEWNAYGKAVMKEVGKEAKKPTAETYKKVGPAEKFQPKEEKK